jgi:hypothetical protein
MDLIVEIFVVQLLSDRVRYHCSRIALTDPAMDPDLIVRRLVEDKLPGRPHIPGGDYLSHSTSWRYEPAGAVILTYLVHAVSIDFTDAATRELGMAELALSESSDPRQPRPVHVAETHVLSHALRHLGFLLRHGDGTLGSKISPQAMAFFAGAVPALAGRL